MRLVIGDALHSLADLGTGGAAAGRQRVPRASRRALPRTAPAWSEGHPLSEAANHLIASMVRKVGGFTFQELNLTIDDIREIGEAGADLSYDFINRPAYHHALATADTEFLRLTLRTTLELGVDPASLVHALQNHDELTYELRALGDRSPRRRLHLQGRRDHRRADRGRRVRSDLIEQLTGAGAPYNLVFTTNGIACTTATVIAAALGITDLDDHRRRRPHPAGAPAAGDVQRPAAGGVRAVRLGSVRDAHAARSTRSPNCSRGGDTRWIHRAAHDLMGVNPDARPVDGRNAARQKPLRLDFPSSSPTRPVSCGSCRRSSRCGRTTGSRPAARSTSPRCRTAACSCWCTSSRGRGTHCS